MEETGSEYIRASAINENEAQPSVNEMSSRRLSKKSH